MTTQLSRVACTSLLLGFVLFGCGLAPAQVLPLQVAPVVAAPTSFVGHAWLLKDFAPLLAALPNGLSVAELPPAPTTPPDASALDWWAQPVSRWMELELRAIKADGSDPPRAARALMLLAVAQNDGLLAAEAARAQGLDIADDAVLAEAAWRILAYTHPQRADGARSDAAFAAWVGVWRGEDTSVGVTQGRLLGAAVAESVLRWAAQDGSSTLSPMLEVGAAAPGRWQPTLPSLDQAQEPSWGEVKTVAIGDPATLLVPAPPAWDSPAMSVQTETFVAAQAALDADDRAIARYWAAGMGTVTPPGMWVEIARDLVARDGLDNRAAAGVYAALGVALHDAAITCWASKYHYQVARPIQWMQLTNPQWTPLLKTPPHPSYPSGHATFGGAASAVLAAAFPADAAALAQQAEDAARSRVLAGIHWPMDGVAGLEQGHQVAKLVLGQLRKEQPGRGAIYHARTSYGSLVPIPRVQ